MIRNCVWTWADSVVLRMIRNCVWTWADSVVLRMIRISARNHAFVTIYNRRLVDYNRLTRISQRLGTALNEEMNR